MKNYFGLIISIVLINITFSQTPCILGDVYVSEGANKGDPDDYIEIVNNGANECSLAGFQLDDSELLEDFTFGDIILSPGSYWLGYEDAEGSFNSGLAGSGDIIVFADAAGNMLTVNLEVAIETVYGLELSQSFTSNGIGCYTIPTPGETNMDCFTFISGCTDPEAINYNADANIDNGSCQYSTISCVLGDVFVSEAANQGDPDDYIEVVNGGSVECTLAGFQLDDTEDLEDFTFSNIIIAPGEYWLGYENAENSFNSGLSAEGDLVVFADASGNLLTVILAEAMATADSLELSQSYSSDGVGCYTTPTPGETNADCFEFPCLLGDLNDDGTWNVLDIVNLANCILAQNCPDIPNGCAGDINEDGNFNVLDIVTLANCVLAQNCGGRVDDASESRLIIRDNRVSFEADGFIGGVQMTLTHSDGFSIEMTDRALLAEYITTGNETRLLVITPETDELFSFSGEFEITEIIVANSQYEVSVDLPLATSFSISEAYPNPFNPVTTMTLTMPVSGEMTVEVYNLLGQVVATLASGYMEASTYTLTWDASNASSGVYFVQADAAGFTKTQKLMLVK